MTLEPSAVCEARCNQRRGRTILMTREIHGKRLKAGESFSAAHIVGYLGTIGEMHAVNNGYKGHTALSVDGSEWRLVE